MTQPIGIVAGWGNYPLSVAKALKAANQSVVVAALDRHADPSISRWADQLSWLGVAKLGAHQKLFRQHGVKKVVLAGKLFKDKMLFHGRGWIDLMPDVECLRAFFHILITRRDDSRDDSLMMAIVNSYQRRGIEIVAGTEYAPDLLAAPGVLTRKRPSRSIQKDIDFGWKIAKQMGGLDIGQSITVRDQAVLAVEAVEGTDACITRTAALCPRGGFTLIKVAKPQQDRRFDQPTIGVQTIERLKRSGGCAIAIEAGETIIVDREEVIRQADAAGITIVSLSSSEINNAN